MNVISNNLMLNASNRNGPIVDSLEFIPTIHSVLSVVSRPVEELLNNLCILATVTIINYVILRI